MRTKLTVMLASLALVLAATTRADGSAEGHHHDSHGSIESPQIQLNAGKKWASDAHLRQAMSDINQAMAKALPLIHKNQFDSGAYPVLAATINQKVAYAVEHCKLEPKADAMLHLVLGDLIAGAERMEGKNARLRHDGAVRVLEALNAYGQYFQHPGWNVARTE